MKRNISNEKGFSLIEFLIAMTIGVLLLSGLIEWFLHCQNSFMLQTAWINLKNNGKLAAAIMQADIKQAGYIGCAKLTSDFPIYAASYPPIASLKLLGGERDITIMHAKYPPIPILSIQKNQVIVPVSAHIQVGDVMLVSDCEKAELIIIKNHIKKGPLQIIFIQTPLHFSFNAKAELSRWEVNHFFIAKTARHHSDGSPIFALFKQGIKQEKTELVEDILQMNIIYLERVNGLIQEKHADQVEHWEEVIGVTIDYLVMSQGLQRHWPMTATLSVI
jgi:type IV pilus assembly protein PilW